MTDFIEKENIPYKMKIKDMTTLTRQHVKEREKKALTSIYKTAPY